MGVAYSTLREWKDKYPALSAALKRGKAPVDTQVENALLKRALGFEYEEVTTETVYLPDGSQRENVRRTVKKALPDTTAQIFWLKNRKPLQWRDKREVDDTLLADDPVLEMLKRWDDASGK